MIIDTDVLIWYMRGNDRARRVIAASGQFSLSAVTYMELVQGMRNKAELNTLRQALHEWQARVLHISEDISARAISAVERHFLSHSLRLADALVGATAMDHGLPLLTGNGKHYKVMTGIEVVDFRP